MYGTFLESPFHYNHPHCISLLKCQCFPRVWLPTNYNYMTTSMGRVTSSDAKSSPESMEVGWLVGLQHLRRCGLYVPASLLSSCLLAVDGMRNDFILANNPCPTHQHYCLHLRTVHLILTHYYYYIYTPQLITYPLDHHHPPPGA